MVVLLSKKKFELFEISEEGKDAFKEATNKELSDFHAEALKWIGDALRTYYSQHFWCDGSYCWYTDETQSHEQCVFMTSNGIAMFEDITEKKLYRIIFK